MGHREIVATYTYMFIKSSRLKPTLFNFRQFYVSFIIISKKKDEKRILKRIAVSEHRSFFHADNNGFDRSNTWQLRTGSSRNHR